MLRFTEALTIRKYCQVIAGSIPFVRQFWQNQLQIQVVSMIHLKIPKIADLSSRVSEKRLLSIIVVVLIFVLGGCGFEQESKHYYEGITLEEGTLYVSARRWKERGLEWLLQGDTQIEYQQRPPLTQAMKEAEEITILIHGYHAPDTVIAAYFKGLINHLRSVEGYRFPMIVFDWPSNARHWEELTNDERIAFMQLGSHNPFVSWEVGAYAADSESAKNVGVDALIMLIQALSVNRTDRRFNIIAHSMGCYVILEAIKKNPQALSSVQSVFWLAPDLKGDVLEDPAFSKELSNLEKLHVFYSKHDGVLAFLSRILHFAVSHPMLGSHGPSNASELPDNVVLHDLSDTLGKDGVHSRYLEKGSAAAVLIGDALNVSDASAHEQNL